MACGTPAVAFRVGAVPDIIEHGVNGYVAEPENVQDLSRGILELLSRDNLKSEMAEKAVKTINDSFTLEHQVKNYLKVCDDLLS